MDVEIEMRAHRLASEMVERIKWQRALGRQSFYNIAREVLIEDFEKEQTEAIKQRRIERRAEDALSRDIVDRNL